MASTVPSTGDVLEVFDAIAPAGTPMTTPEVAAEFDCTDRTIYNRLDDLVEEGCLETKKVGARGRVWWRPPNERDAGSVESGRRSESRREDPDRDRTGDRDDSCYRALFDCIDEGVVLADVVFGDEGRVIDVRTRTTNAAAREMICERLDTDTEPLWERDPAFRRDWFEISGRVATTGEGERRELYVEPLEMWLDCYVFRQPDAADRQVAAIFQDVTRRKRVEQRLEEERDMFAGGPTVVFRWKPVGEDGWPVEYVSDNVEDVLGYTADELESGDVLYTDLIPDEELERIAREAAGDIGAAPEGFGNEPYRVTTRDGDVRWVSHTTEVVRDESGEVASYLGYLIDVTERKERERQLEQYRALTRIARDVIVTIDGSSTIQSVNPAVEDVFGYTPAELVGESLTTLMSPDLAGDHLSAVARHLESGERSFDWSYVELPGRHRDGSSIPLAISFSETDYDDERYFTGVVRDISERTRREERQRFLMELTDRLQPLSDPDEVKTTAARHLGEELGLSQVGYVAVGDDGETAVAGGEYSDGRMPSPDGYDVDLAGYGEAIGSELRSGEEFFSTDLQAESAIPEAATAEAEALGIRGCAAIPLHKDSRLVSLLYAAHPEPRDWPEHERRLLREVAERTWDAVTRARVEARLREKEEQQAYSLELSDRLRRLEDPVDVQYEAARTLTEHLGADRAFYAAVSESDAVVVERDYHGPDVSSVAGRHGSDSFGEVPGKLAASGETVTVDDVTTDAALSEPEARAHLDRDVAAFITVPLVKEGRLHAYFAVHQRRPRKWTPDEVALVEETAERTWAAGQRAHAEAVRRRTIDALERLNDASHELMEADAAAIGDLAADVAGSVLDVEHVSVWRYDEGSGELRRHATHSDPASDPEAFRLPDSFGDTVWQTFVGDDVEVAIDLAGSERSPPEQAPESRRAPALRNVVLVPLGRHGVLCAGASRPDSFDDDVVDLAETVAATVEAAWDRAEGEQQLAERNAELEQLDRLNALIRGIDQVLVEADDREAIEASVCDRLADSELYEFAWIGEVDPVDDRLAPREWAGVDRGYLADLTVAPTENARDCDPIAAAVRTREVQVVDDIAVDAGAAAWREATLERGARSCICIPMVYNGSLHGVLTVYADRPRPDERNHTVLAEFGETIAHAIDAIETKRTLLTDSVVELTLDIRDGDDVLAALTREADSEIQFEGFVPGSDGLAHLFFSTRGDASEGVLAAARGVPGIAEATVIRDEAGSCTYEATVTGATVAAHVVENHGLVDSLTVTGDGSTAVVHLPAAADARSFVETLRETYADVSLVARRTRDRPIHTREDLHDALSEELTARQREILETAYWSGFFESPRAQTGRELSDMLDITQSTFSHHVREAERRLCKLVFENAHPDSRG